MLNTYANALRRLLLRYRFFKKEAYRLVSILTWNSTQALLKLSCCAVLMAFGFRVARAQNAETGGSAAQLKGLSLFDLGNVQVTTVTKEPEQLWQTPAAIFVITSDDIRRSGATSVPEALRLAPGVEVARIDSDHWSVGIRGFGSEFSKAVLVLIDGRSVYTPLFAGVYWQVQNVMLEDVDRIEVIRGPGGTIWGANAVNGVINIITKSSTATHGTLASVSGGDMDQGTGNFRIGGGNGRGFDYRLYGMAFGRAHEFHPDGGNFDDWQMGQGGFRADWQKNSRDSLTFQGDLYKGFDGERVQVSLYSPPSTETFNSPHDVGGGNLLARWHRQINEGSDFQIQTYYDRTSRLSPQLDELRNTADIDALYHFRWRARQDISVGAGARWSPDEITKKFATLDFVPENETDSIYSWFLQDQIALLPNRLSLTIGSKFEHNNYSGFEIQPNARLLWAPTAHQSVWVSVTRAVRTPSRLDRDLKLTDLLLTGPPPLYLRVAGSANFKSENLLGTEAGYRTGLTSNLYLDTSFFYNKYDDLYGYGPTSVFVELSPLPPHVVGQVPLANANAGDTAGVEIAPDWKPFSWWDMSGSYSFLHLSVHGKQGVAGALNSSVVASDNGSSPHHQVQMQSRFNLPKALECDFSYRFVSALPAQTAGPGTFVAAYSTADVRFGGHLAEGLEWSVVGQNLLQPHHAEFGGDDGPLVGMKRDFYVKIVWKK